MPHSGRSQMPIRVVSGEGKRPFRVPATRIASNPEMAQRPDHIISEVIAAMLLLGRCQHKRRKLASEVRGLA